MSYGFETSLWYGYMDGAMRALARESFRLAEFFGRAENQGLADDYGFVVFPIAKAYEGFLKKVFLDLGLISRQQFESEHFRIGRALNPILPKRYRVGWVYERLVRWCGGEDLAMELWEMWKKGRNRVFHFFPGVDQRLSYAEAVLLVRELAETMEKVMRGCKLRVGEIVGG